MSVSIEEKIGLEIDIFEEYNLAIESLEEIYDVLNQHQSSGVSVEAIEISNIATGQALSRINMQSPLASTLENIAQNGSSDTSTTMALEGIVDTITAIFRKIKKWLVRIKDSLKAFFGMFRTKIDKLESKRGNLLKYLNDAGDSNVPKVKIGTSSANMLSTKVLQANIPKNVLTSVTIVESYSNLFDGFEKLVDKVIMNYIKGLQTDFDKNKKSGGEFYNFDFGNRLALFANTRRVDFEDEKGAIVYSTNIFPGGYTWTFTDYEGRYSYMPIYQYREFHYTGEHCRNVYSQMMAKSDIKRLLDLSGKMLGAYRHSLDKNERYFNTLVNALSRALEKRIDRDQSPDVRRAHRNTVNAHQMLLRRQKEAFNLFMEYVLKYNSAVLNYANSMIKAYN